MLVEIGGKVGKENKRVVLHSRLFNKDSLKININLLQAAENFKQL